MRNRRDVRQTFHQRRRLPMFVTSRLPFKLQTASDITNPSLQTTHSSARHPSTNHCTLHIITDSESHHPSWLKSSTQPTPRRRTSSSRKRPPAASTSKPSKVSARKTISTRHSRSSRDSSSTSNYRRRHCSFGRGHCRVTQYLVPDTKSIS